MKRLEAAYKGVKAQLPQKQEIFLGSLGDFTTKIETMLSDIDRLLGYGESIQFADEEDRVRFAVKLNELAKILGETMDDIHDIGIGIESKFSEESAKKDK